MSYISSEKIKEELMNNFEENEVFGVYNRSILFQVEDHVEKEENDIYLVLDENTIYSYDKHRRECDASGHAVMSNIGLEHEVFWNHLIALLFMQQLKDRYHMETSHNLLEEEKYFTEKNYGEYLEIEKQLLSREDVLETIDNIDPLRVHIIVKCGISGVDNEIGHYLQDKYAFITMVYTEGNGIGSIITRPETGGVIIEDCKCKKYYRDELISDNTKPVKRLINIRKEKRN